MTYNQLINNQRRVEKSKKIRSPAMRGKPQHSGIVLKRLIVTPKKPNSAKRKVAKVNLRIQGMRSHNVLAYIPDTEDNIHEHSKILIRGGRVPDLIGVKYHCIRGKGDLAPSNHAIRHQRRSKYSIKNFNRPGKGY